MSESSVISRKVLFYGHDVWTKFFRMFVDSWIECNNLKMDVVYVSSAAEFNELNRDTSFNGFIFVFNPFLHDFKVVWQSLQDNPRYPNNRILFFGNTGGVPYCNEYCRRDIDLVVDFCDKDTKQMVEILLSYTNSVDTL